MKYLLIADSPATLPFAVDIDEETIEQALNRATTMEAEEGFMTCLFMVDLESGEAKRMYRDGEAWAVSDTAYERNLGVATPDEYFQEAGTMEIAE
jgi:non-canonical (house-cleaning) NTP pyrophosphatase